VAALPANYSSRIYIKSVPELGKPANLPFGLIVWAKKYVHRMNCLYNRLHGIPDRVVKMPKKLMPPPCSNYPNETSDLASIFRTPRRITHVYYTESDQLLKFANADVRDAILAAVNATTHLIGRRKEVQINLNKDPTQYMEGMLSTRALCGNQSNLYELNTKDMFVRAVR
jgi:hypothetical protein